MIRREFIQSIVGGLLTWQTPIIPYLFPSKKKELPNIVMSVFELGNDEVFQRNGVYYTQPSISYVIPLRPKEESNQDIDFNKYKYAIRFKYKNYENTLYFDNQKTYNITMMRYQSGCFLSESAYDLIISMR